MIGERWGVTDDEVARPYPCDRWVPAPDMTAWRGVTVRAAADQVWPWVTQVRLAPYSYDWLDNLGHRSPRQLMALQDPAEGDAFTSVGGRRCGRVLSVESGRQLTGRIAGAVISYVLDQPCPEDPTRLLMKVVANAPRPTRTLLCVGDLVMARRQLLNWKRLAEATA